MKPMQSRSEWREQSPIAGDGIAQVLDLVYALNEHCLWELRDCAATASTQCEAVLANREAWRALNGEAIQRAARFPLTLLNVEFENVSFWTDIIKIPVRSARSTGNAFFPASKARELTWECVMLAWHAIRTVGTDALGILGMKSAVARIFLQMPLRDLPRISQRHFAALEMRWADAPAWWGSFLAAAIDGNFDALHDHHLHSYQQLGGTLLGIGKSGAAKGR